MRHLILDIMAEKNLTLSFWGDSVQHQVFDGFICEISRRNYTILNSEMNSISKLGDSSGLMSITTVTVASPNWQQQENQNLTIKFFAQNTPKTKPKPLLEG
jgi:hypothetical protein